MRFTYNVYDEIKKQLLNYKGLNDKLKRTREKLEELENLTFIKSVRMDQIQHQSIVDGQGSVIAKNIQLKEELKETEIELSYTLDNLKAGLNELKKHSNKKLYEIIERRYFFSESINAICKSIGIDRSTYYRWEKQALEIIKPYMPM